MTGDLTHLLMQRSSNDPSDQATQPVGGRNNVYRFLCLEATIPILSEASPCGREAKEAEAGVAVPRRGDKATNHHRSNKCAIESAASRCFPWMTALPTDQSEGHA